MFQKIIVPYIVPLSVLSRVVPEVKSVSELKIGIELLKLPNLWKKNSAPVPWDKSDILNSRTLKGLLLKIMVANGDFILFSFFCEDNFKKLHKCHNVNHQFIITTTSILNYLHIRPWHIILKYGLVNSHKLNQNAHGNNCTLR